MAHSELYIGDLVTPDFLFTDSDLTRVNGAFSVDMVGDRLSQDEMEMTVSWDKVGANIQVFAPSNYDAILSSDLLFFATSYTGTDDLLTVPYGTPCWYYFDNSLIGKFYTKRIIRTGKSAYEITLMSCVGLLSNLLDYGGIYTAKDPNPDYFKDVLAEILGGSVGALDNGQYPITGGVFECYVEEQVGDQRIDGWLPIATKRENLHQLMFAEGVSLTKAADGTPVFSFLYTDPTPTVLADAKVYLGGNIDYNSPATAIEVTEHNYLDLGTSDELVTLFDGQIEGTVTNATIQFNEPMHDLIATSVTVSTSGANYAVISGSGTLQGYKYTKSQRTVSRQVLNPTGETNEISIRDVTLVNILNSANIAERLLAYYSAAQTVEMDVIKTADPQCGRQYSFTDPFEDSRTGFVTKMSLSPSNIMKARCQLITDYTPKNGGNNFSNAKLYTSGSITVPADVTTMRLILISGGSGGKTSGTNGQAGGRPTMQFYESGGYGNYLMYTAIGGDGGTGGNGGDAGRVLTVDLTNLVPLSTIQVSYGTGGAAGSAGTDTTITYNGTTYSTVTGSVPAGGIINLFNGEKYAAAGQNGLDGGRGADAHDDPNQDGTQGGSVSYNGVTYQGGLGGRYTSVQNNYWSYQKGAGGGGAAYGQTGGNAHPDSSSDFSVSGGDGANADVPPKPLAGCGGTGGCGGGGGGGTTVVYNLQTGRWNTTAISSGGTGSAAGEGGDGAVLAYY